jgi:hypothetical protein
MWRLVEFELGQATMTLSRTSYGQSVDVGSCVGGLRSVQPGMPRILLDLRNNGLGDTYAESYAVTLSYSERCVTSQLPELTCDSSDWELPMSCSLDCDLCSCTGTMPETSSGDGWTRTQTTLTFPLWGQYHTFDYCISAGRLRLGSESFGMVFERVFPLAQPQPCAERDLASCSLGEGCTVGACVGAATCEALGTESSCLTQQGCNWDATLCGGQAVGDCSIGDYGAVPGCELLQTAPLCLGTPPPCGDRTEAECEVGDGCTLSTLGRCVGGTFDCSSFAACPIGYCTYTSSSECVGTTSCSARDSEEACGWLIDVVGDACQWVDYSCIGDPEPCSSNPAERCDEMPGCQLNLAP